MSKNSDVGIKIIKPQPKQELFLSSSADIVIYGGAAGGGKSYAALLDPLRHLNNGQFGAVIFRRSMPAIRNEGGIWDTSKLIYPLLGAKPVETPRPIWRFPSGMRVSFAQIENENTLPLWHSAQIPLMIFEELTEFTRTMFFYMLSRNRSSCGVKPYVRGTCNPEPGWLADFIEWWIDKDTGYAIPERSGKLRYMLRADEDIIWGDSKRELIEKYPTFEENDIKSVTFIYSSVYDNPALLKTNPQYLGNLKAQSYVDRERLLHGNWKVRPAPGLYFKRSQVTMLDAVPSDVDYWVRRWDLAATEVTEQTPDPDWTAGVLVGKRKSGRYVFADSRHVRENAASVRQLVKNTASMDKSKYGRVKIIIPQDPGQAGKDQNASYIQMLAGFIVDRELETKDKVTRAEPLAAQWQAGNVDVVVGDWNETFFSELESFPSAKAKDDQVDAAAGGFNNLPNAAVAKLPSKMSTTHSYWKL